MNTNTQIQAFISLAKPNYCPGEQINGTINLIVSSPFRGQNLMLKLKGGEFVEFTKIEREGYEEYDQHANRSVTRYRNVPKHYQENRLFYNQPASRVTSFSGNSGYINPGQYSFPFSFKLGQNLAASFNHEWREGQFNCFARTQYSLEALIQDHLSSTQTNNCIAQTQIKVMPLNDGSAKNKKVDIKKSVSCCCKNFGETKIAAYFEKDKYSIGSTAYMVVEIDNRKGDVGFKKVRATFTQTLKFQAKGESTIQRKVLSSTTQDGIQAGQTVIGRNARRFAILIKGNREVPVFGSSKGHLVACTHKLAISLDPDVTCFCGSGPEASITIPIFEQDMMNNQQNPAFMEANWQPKVNPTHVFNARMSTGVSTDYPSEEDFERSDMSPMEMSSHKKNF